MSDEPRQDRETRAASGTHAPKIFLRTKPGPASSAKTAKAEFRAPCAAQNRRNRLLMETPGVGGHPKESWPRQAPCPPQSTPGFHGTVESPGSKPENPPAPDAPIHTQ